MRLSTKLTLVIVAGIASILLLHGFQRVRIETEMFTNDVQRDHRTLAHGLRLAAQTVADRSGIARAVMVLEGANARDSRLTIRWFPPSSGHDPVHTVSRVEQDETGSTEWLVTDVPLTLRDKAGTLEIRESLDPERAQLREATWKVAWVMLELAALCTIVIAGAGFLFVERPMQKLMGKVRRIGRGDLTGPLVLTSQDEVGQLAREVNAMCEQLDVARKRAEHEAEARLSAVEQMRHADRLSIVGRIASGVAHELGTPLNVVLAHAHMIERREARDDAAVVSANAIVGQTERMADIIRQLLHLARRGTPQKSPEDLVSLAQRTLSLMEPVAARSGVALRLGRQDFAVAHIDSAQLQQVIANLVVNAIQAQPNGGEVLIDVQSDGAEAVIAVRDRGVGIPKDQLAHVFEPFFTTKASGEGTGLGLTVSDDIVRDHGGRIELESVEGRGTTFWIRLPLHQSKPAS